MENVKSFDYVNVKTLLSAGAGGIAGKMRMFVGQEPEFSEMDLPDVPEEDPVERPPYYEYMVHTPDEGGWLLLVQ